MNCSCKVSVSLRPGPTETSCTGTPASSAGLKPGDVLLEINKTPIQSVQSFTTLYKNAKDNILLLVYRGGSTMYLVIRR